MRAAFVAPGEAPVDPVAVAFVGDDEDLGLGACGRRCHEEQARKERDVESHDAPMSERTACMKTRPKSLRMINHGGGGQGFGAKKGFFATLDAMPRSAAWWVHERFPRHLLH